MTNARTPHGWAGLAQFAVPELAPQAVRERIRKRWEQRRAETASGTRAFSRWRFDGRYAYRESGYGWMSDSEVEAVEPHHQYLVAIWEADPL